MCRVLSKCFLCRKLGAAPGDKLIADLLKESLTSTYVGVNYFGPLYVQQGRSHVKGHGHVVTCLTTRAVHIEITHSLDTNYFINTLHRFIYLVFGETQHQFTTTMVLVSKGGAKKCVYRA